MDTVVSAAANIQEVRCATKWPGSAEVGVNAGMQPRFLCVITRQVVSPEDKASFLGWVWGLYNNLLFMGFMAFKRD